MYPYRPQDFDKWTLKQFYLIPLEKYAILKAVCGGSAICWNIPYVDNQVDLSIMQTHVTVNLKSGLC